MRDVRRAFAACGAVVAGLTLVLTGCSPAGSATSSTGTPSESRRPDVSAKGQIDYVCALARDVKENHGRFTASNFSIGDEASAAEYEVGGAEGLLGAPVGGHVPHAEELSKAAMTMYVGTSRLEMKTLNKGVTTLSSRCEARRLPAGDPDISTPGRIAYACALVTDLKKNHDPVTTSTFGTLGKADPAELEAGGAAGLLGAMSGSQLAGHRDMSDAAAQLLQGCRLSMSMSPSRASTPSRRAAGASEPRGCGV